jgi:hypothetical protein
MGISSEFYASSELANWIMSMGPRIEVMKPVALRKDIARRHAEASRMYRGTT